MARIKIDGLKELEKKLKANVTMDLVKQTVQGNGIELREKMIAKAEFTKGYQTGTTKRSITRVSKDSGFSVEVGPTTEYSPYLEYGTRFMEAQPFVRPALEEQATQFHSDMQKLVR